jgi:flagellar motor switch protein FliM
MTVEPYHFANAERVRLGRFPVLDTLLYRWARRIEETLFERFHLELYAGASIVEEMKFSAFFAGLKRPRPIYFFGMEPFAGEGLFVLDNRFSNLCLGGKGTRGSDDSQRLAPHNHGRLQAVVQQMMADFDACWADVHPVKTHLNRISTYLFRARILNAYEPCLVAQIHLSGDNVSSRMIWCFPRVMLEPVLDKLSHVRVVPSLVADRARQQPRSADELLARSDYRLRVRMGTVDPRRGRDGLQVGSVLPLDNPVGGDAMLEINGRPLLVGKMGELQGRYAVQVTGTYETQRRPIAQDPAAFRSISWPRAGA